MTNFCNLSDYSRMLNIFLVANNIQLNDDLVHIILKNIRYEVMSN